MSFNRLLKRRKERSDRKRFKEDMQNDKKMERYYKNKFLINKKWRKKQEIQKQQNDFNNIESKANTRIRGNQEVRSNSSIKKFYKNWS